MPQIIIINRAVPGSGKSTMSKAIQDILVAGGYSCKIHSTDEYHMIDGEYKFDPSKIGHYHSENYREFTKSVKQAFDCVICDNTNIKDKDAKPYAEVISYVKPLVIVLYFVSDSLDNHIARNVHKVPSDVIQNMSNALNNAKNIGEKINIMIRPDTFKQDLQAIPTWIKSLIASDC